MRGRLQSVAILVFVPVAWGYNWVVMKKALAYAGPFEFSALRFAPGRIPSKRVYSLWISA